jgi:hypothetical protein
MILMAEGGGVEMRGHESRQELGLWLRINSRKMERNLQADLLSDNRVSLW